MPLQMIDAEPRDFSNETNNTTLAVGLNVYV